MEEEAGKKFLIEVLNRGILDLNEFAILSSVITKRAEPEDYYCGICHENCGCKYNCIPKFRDIEVTSDEYRSDEVAGVLEKIIAEYGPTLK